MHKNQGSGEKSQPRRYFRISDPDRTGTEDGRGSSPELKKFAGVRRRGRSGHSRPDPAAGAAATGGGEGRRGRLAARRRLARAERGGRR